VINIVTVHWQTPRWVEVQLAYLERNVSGEFRVFAALNGIDNRSIWERFHFAEDLEGSHGIKLNALANTVLERAHPSDMLIFIDGDAFPIRPLMPWLDEAVFEHRLVAIRRDENLGDRQPHPSFCATTVGFWREIGGDWRGEAWTNAAGREVVDVGGKLLHSLDAHGVDWLPLLRTNTYNPHPLWFGVYAHRVYHHGGGFQPARAERVDWLERYQQKPGVGRPLRPTNEHPSLGTLRARVESEGLRMRQLRPRHVPVMAGAAVKTWRLRREHRYFTKLQSSERGRHLQQLNDSVFSQLSSDPEFYRQFDDAVS
jgi:hypothetical protein